MDVSFRNFLHNEYRPMSNSCHGNVSPIMRIFPILVVMTELKGRFISSAFVLFRVLRFVGLNPFRLYNTNKKWSWFCFFLIFQAGLYIALERSIPHLNGFFQNVNHMIPVLDRFFRFFSISVVFFSFILKFDKIVNAFCLLLEPVDYELQRPDLTWIRYSSIAGVTWIFILFFTQTFSTMYWEFVLRKSTPYIYWLENIQQFFRVVSYVIFDISVVTFWVSGQLVVVFYQNLAKEIAKNVSPTIAFNCFTSLHPQLSAAASHLCKQFDLILLINYLHAISCLLFFSDALISELPNPELRVQVALDMITIIDCVLRLWLINHTADQIRHAALRCITDLRRLRDDSSYKEVIQTSRRNQITLVTIEVTKTLPKLSLLGLVILTKGLLIRVFETLIAYLLMISEFRNWK